jgi:redox-sensitive bicupin YhaK (pirin superfamily)
MTTSTVDLRLRDEALRFALRFSCESCAHFAPETLACGNGFPTHPHRGVDLSRVQSLEFCKAFELA